MHRLSGFVVSFAVAAVTVVGFAPVASATAPPPATWGTHRPGDSRVALSWHNPTSSTDFRAVRLFYRPGDQAPTGVDDPAAIEVDLSAGKASSAEVTGLTNGQHYTFVVYTTDNAGGRAASNPLTMTPHAPRAGHFTIQLSRTSIGTALDVDSAVLSGTYTDAAGKPVGGLHVAVQRQVGGTSTWQKVYTATTGASGRLHMNASPQRTVTYRFHLPSSPYDAALTSTTVRLRYYPTVSAVVPSLARTYTRFAIRGTTYPRMSGQSIALQRYYDGAWHTVANTNTGAKGNYGFWVTRTTTATQHYRTVYRATAAHQRDVSGSHKVTVVPRDLKSGMSGPDVLALQRRLVALHYDVGSADGEFGYNTLHAVVPFQKVNGLPRTGVVDSRTLAKLGSPATVSRRHLVSGRSVEVNITKQVAAFYQDGSLYRIVDVSTGSEEVYYQDGVRNVAHTPRGSFQVERKIDGMRVSKLGELWRPSYFYAGYALHGSPSVPPYPASHGCVRMTNPAVDRYFDWLRIGTRVYVFD